MRRHLRWLLLPSILFVLVAAGLPAAPAAGHESSVRSQTVAAPLASYYVNGTVTDGLTVAPVPGASLRASSGPSTASATDGSFTLLLASGVQTLTVTHPGYHGRSVTINVRASTVLNITLTPYTWVVSGVVLDSATSTPIIGALVQVFPTNLNVMTGGSGQYRFTLENGTYFLNASAAGFASGSVTVTVSGSALVKYIDLSPGGNGPPTGPNTALLVAILGVIAAGIVGFAYFVLRRWGIRFRRGGTEPPLAGIPAQRDPNAPPPSSRAKERAREGRRRT